MKVLVTGGNGFLGSTLARNLVDKGYGVRILHRKTSDMQLLHGLAYESALGDVTDLDSVDRACGDIDFVFHVAALISYSPREYQKMYDVNVGGTENIIKAILKNKVKRLIHTSSVAAVGASFDETPLNEKSIYNMGQFGFGYYDTKKEAEDLIGQYIKTTDLDAVILNPSLMYGPGDFLKSSRSTQLKVAAGKIPFYSYGGINAIDVGDAVEGHIRAIEKGKRGERYILGGENLTIKALFAWIAGFDGHRAPWIPLPDLVMRSASKVTGLISQIGLKSNLSSDSLYISSMFHWYDTSKATKELGLVTQSPFNAVQKSLRWAKDHDLF